MNPRYDPHQSFQYYFQKYFLLAEEPTLQVAGRLAKLSGVKLKLKKVIWSCPLLLVCY